MSSDCRRDPRTIASDRRAFAAAGIARNGIRPTFFALHMQSARRNALVLREQSPDIS
jgi:hypothetical protein